MDVGLFEAAAIEGVPIAPQSRTLAPHGIPHHPPPEPDCDAAPLAGGSPRLASSAETVEVMSTVSMEQFSAPPIASMLNELVMELGLHDSLRPRASRSLSAFRKALSAAQLAMRLCQLRSPWKKLWLLLA